MAADDQSQMDQEDQLFLYLVSTFYSSAWMQMGKIENPVTNKVERDLEQAQLSIDILDVLKKKTQGNLTDQEQQYIDRALRELKSNYMEEKKKDAQQPKGEASESSSEGKSNIITPGEESESDDEDSSKSSSNLWTP